MPPEPSKTGSTASTSTAGWSEAVDSHQKVGNAIDTIAWRARLSPSGWPKPPAWMRPRSTGRSGSIRAAGSAGRMSRQFRRASMRPARRGPRSPVWSRKGRQLSLRGIKDHISRLVASAPCQPGLSPPHRPAAGARGTRSTPAASAPHRRSPPCHRPRRRSGIAGPAA